MSSANTSRHSALYLAIDQGGHGSRAAVYTSGGQQIAQARVACPSNRPQAGFVEQRAEDILDSLHSCLAQISNSLGTRTYQLRSAGLACQGSTLVCWDKITGQPLSPVISWQDCRAAALLNTLSLPSASELHNSTGLRLSPHYGASKFLWCLQHLEAVREAAAAQRLVLGPLASYILQSFTSANAALVDASHAQRTLLWSLPNNNWAPDLCRAFEIETHHLPQCRDNISAFGELTIGNVQVPLSVCLRDQGASLFGRGEPRADSAYINLGTGAFVQRLASASAAPAGLLLSPLLFDGAERQCSWEATVNGAAAAMPWLTAALDCELTPSRIDRALKEDANKPSQPRFFINTCAGLGSPYWRTDITPEFSPGLSRAEKICAWIESIIFLLHINLQRLQTQSPLNDLCISGGLSGSDPLCQGLANLTGLAVKRAQDPEATLGGVAYLAAKRPHHWQSSPRSDQTFEPQTSDKLHRNFHFWHNAMQERL